MMFARTCSKGHVLRAIVDCVRSRARAVRSRAVAGRRAAWYGWRVTPPAKVRKLPLVLGLLALVATPLATRLLVHGDMPDTWGTFPPPKSPDVPGFSGL